MLAWFSASSVAHPGQNEAGFIIAGASNFSCSGGVVEKYNERMTTEGIPMAHVRGFYMSWTLANGKLFLMGKIQTWLRIELLLDYYYTRMHYNARRKAVV